MKILAIFCLFSLVSISQTVVKTPMKAKYSCSQKYGLTESAEDYILKVSYSGSTLKFNTRKDQPMEEYSVAKKTSKYVIGKNTEGNYAFYDIAKKQFFFIDYFMSRYTTAGYGKDSADAKQKVLKMMELLKSKKSQKDVIQYLIKQTEYDF